MDRDNPGLEDAIPLGLNIHPAPLQALAAVRRLGQRRREVQDVNVSRPGLLQRLEFGAHLGQAAQLGVQLLERGLGFGIVEALRGLDERFQKILGIDDFPERDGERIVVHF